LNREAPYYCGGLHYSCCSGSGWDNAGEKAQKTIQTMSSSNNIVSQRISDMAGDVLKPLLLRLKASEFYASQLEESTDVAGLAQLLVYVRYVYGGSINGGILFCKPGQQEIIFSKYWIAL
jgi:hypothetical protein